MLPPALIDEEGPEAGAGGEVSLLPHLRMGRPGQQ